MNVGAALTSLLLMTILIPADATVEPASEYPSRTVTSQGASTGEAGVDIGGTVAPHSPNVVSVIHAPALPSRGAEILVRVVFREGANESSAILAYCRVENYACARPSIMERTSDGAYQGAISWSEEFFAGVTHVGYRIIVGFANGSYENSPLANWPYTPQPLNGTEARYYIYDLPPEVRNASSAPIGLGLLAVLVLVKTTLPHRRS
ncbi:MAG: hypothetical protein HY556_03925 [Euryarchaeota archaeon]|nr:hypothetical protein [Euryarchaeota archaeon]